MSTLLGTDQCGERGIRTPDNLSDIYAFQAYPFNHSGISPSKTYQLYQLYRYFKHSLRAFNYLSFILSPMFPLYDSSPRNTFPFINYILIGLNIFVFYLQLTAPNFEEFIYQYAFIPQEFSLFDPSSYFYIFTSIFMHGGFLHILSNLWFLHIFGDNVEDSMGNIPYLFFYLGAGVVATLAQYFLMAESSIPMIGASGAISGVSGAYLILYGRSRIKSLIFLGIFITTVELPAWFFLGYWFVLQIISGFANFDPSAEAGVAWFAHIGGFMFGWFASSILPRKKYQS